VLEDGLGMYHMLCIQRAAFHFFDTLSVPLLHSNAYGQHGMALQEPLHSKVVS